MQSDDFNARGTEGPEQSDPNLSGANDENALAHSLAGWPVAFCLTAARSSSAACDLIPVAR